MNLDELLNRCDELDEKATPDWECKDHPEAPFDGQFRVLGRYLPSHVPGKSFDDREWAGFFAKYENCIFAVESRTLLPILAAIVRVQREALEEIDIGDDNGDKEIAEEALATAERLARGEGKK